MQNKKPKLSVDLDNNLVNVDEQKVLSKNLQELLDSDSQSLTTYTDESPTTKKWVDTRIKAINHYNTKKALQQTDVLTQEIKSTQLKVKKVSVIWCVFIFIFAFINLGCAIGTFFVDTDSSMFKILGYSMIAALICIIGCLVGFAVHTNSIKDKLIAVFSAALATGLPITPKNPKYLSRLINQNREAFKSLVIKEAKELKDIYFKRSKLKVFGFVLLTLSTLTMLVAAPMAIVNYANDSIFSITFWITMLTNITTALSLIFIIAGQSIENKIKE